MAPFRFSAGRAGTLEGKKILFATFPADGHFNPLTGLAVHLKNVGCEVAWYTSQTYARKLGRLQIRHYPFKHALDVSSSNFDDLFPARKNLKGLIKKLRFDIINAFILRGPEYFQDIQDIYKEYPFDAVVCDCAFTGIPFIKEKIGVPVFSLGIIPLTQSSRNLPPTGLGLIPSKTFFGQMKQAVLRFLADKILFRKPMQVMKEVLAKEAIEAQGTSIFDMLINKSTLLLQAGTPRFEYERSDLARNIRFIGPLLPFKGMHQDSWTSSKLTQYQKIILVTQGTVEKDITKLLKPTLDAFRSSNYLVIATTGGSGTEQLRQNYPDENIIIEDFIPFDDIMPYADVYITNGGYGGVMLAIQHKLPMVVAGVHEGKNEINARVEYFKLGINLRTEFPRQNDIRKAVEKVMTGTLYTDNVRHLSKEFRKYNAVELCAAAIAEKLNRKPSFEIVSV